MKTGFYTLSSKLPPVGSNRVDFQIEGNRINVNFSGWRNAPLSEIEQIKIAEKKTALKNESI